MPSIHDNWLSANLERLVGGGGERWVHTNLSYIRNHIEFGGVECPTSLLHSRDKTY